jgi:hypothetical protein
MSTIGQIIKYPTVEIGFKGVISVFKNITSITSRIAPAIE